MIQKCKNCGCWCSAPYKKSPYALGRFIDSLFGTEGGAEFKCQCGNTWMELDRRKDQTAQYNKENSEKGDTSNTKSTLQLSGKNR